MLGLHALILSMVTTQRSTKLARTMHCLLGPGKFGSVLVSGAPTIANNRFVYLQATVVKVAAHSARRGTEPLT